MARSPSLTGRLGAGALAWFGVVTGRAGRADATRDRRSRAGTGFDSDPARALAGTLGVAVDARIATQQRMTDGPAALQHG